MKTVLHFIITICFLVISAEKSNAQKPSNNQKPISELFQLANTYQQDYNSLSRFYVIQNSPEKRKRFETLSKDYISKLDALQFDQLSRDGKVDYILIKQHLVIKLFELSTEQKEYDLLYKWIGFGEPLYELEKQRRRGKQMDWVKVAGQLNSITDTLHRHSETLKAGNITFSKALTKRAVGIISGQKMALKRVYEFYNNYDPQFTWWVETPYKTLNNALEDYAELIKSKVDYSTMPKDDGSGIRGNPIGKTEILRRLKNEMIPYTPEELVEIAMKEFAWCETELLKASNDMGFGDHWKDAQEKIKQSYVPVGQQPAAMYKLYNESVTFLKSKDLLTIPTIAEETWRMTMLSPKRQLIAPFFLGGEELQIAYPTNSMSHEDKLMSLRGNNPHFARAVLHHELIAGHHLQQFMNKRYKAYRFYNTPFWGEGWALYWEMILWDEGFAQSPEDRIGMLFWRMHRCARIIFSLNYHLGAWTPQQCIDYLVDKVGHERATAEGEVRRSFTGNYGPLYQIAYMIGALQFYKLKTELVDSGKMTYKTFHDTILHENNMPVEMVRALLMDIPLDKNFESSWKFYKK
ncbi:DUF885 family protein [Algibacter mikhailovii]|uniref:X-Pro dipeptidyl-peptidase n=1 Tax=Algibacter mikhailovii TaxID=425498 RepID=A0A918R8K0_9FLAO|nr:DUF885 family protein [Algibacter mikhailovii]GGZ90406.1 X-Pro dipeptidyl-peptidase [Algibacter mikhailovii]